MTKFQLGNWIWNKTSAVAFKLLLIYKLLFPICQSSKNDATAENVINYVFVAIECLLMKFFLLFYVGDVALTRFTYAARDFAACMHMLRYPGVYQPLKGYEISETFMSM